MTVRELVSRLTKFNPDLEVAILNAANGCGDPCTINLGPHIHNPADRPYSPPYDYSDIETEPSMPIVIMGYGCY